MTTTTWFSGSRAAAIGAAVLLVSGCIPRPGSHPAPSRGLAAIVDSVTNSPELRRTTFGIEVFDPATSQVIYALNADKHFVPASNTKLVVTTAAMSLLGPDWRYHTDVYALGLDARGNARALQIVARGDPTWAPPFQPTDTWVPAQLADSIRAAGVRRIDGDLVVDASAFEPMGVNPSWEVGDLVWDYSAPTGAMAVGEGTRRLLLLPGVAPGLPGGVRFLGPELQRPVVNDVTTAEAGTRPRFEPERWPGNDTLYVRGRVPAGEVADTETITVTDPVVYAARVLAGELAARGIQVVGTVRVVYDSALARQQRESTPARRVATWTSAPVGEIVATLLKPSDNWLAEQLLKTLGAVKDTVGSWRAGLAVERAFLTGTVGLDSLDFHLRDGSGLSAQDLLTPHAIVHLLGYARATPWGPTYVAALAEPGQEGTLRRRLLAYAGRLHAKTGSIANVNSLSGFIRTTGGRELVFSILSNGSGVPASLVRAAIDRILTAVAETGGGK